MVSAKPLPNLAHPGTQGALIKMIADNNERRSVSDALHWVRMHMMRGLSFPEALVEELRLCRERPPLTVDGRWSEKSADKEPSE